MREELKLFGDFSKEKIYIEFRDNVDETTKKNLAKLEETVDNHKLAGNILPDLLIPLRNIVFHYDPDKANEWLKDGMKDERVKTP